MTIIAKGVASVYSEAMSHKTLIVLDFDGVICDSIDECFLSSWIAYHTLFKSDNPSSVPLAARRRFAGLRPFIRTGEDFVLIQEIMDTGAQMRSQEQFDEAMGRAGPEKRALWRGLFYKARTGLLETDKGSWLALNRIYPHVAKAFARLPLEAPLVILSTKKPRFIAEILTAHAIRIPEERIYLADSAPKLVMVERLRREGSFETAILVEDQIDAIRGNTNPLIKGLLATWGYVKPEWLKMLPAADLLTPERFPALLDQELFRR
jgi:phosphoglycolate phosphatase-like HAD superfamily hydrolase